MTTMRLCAALAMLTITVTVAADSDAVNELSTLLDRFLAGATANDLATHQRFWSEDLVYTSSSGARFGKADILDGIRAAATADDDGDVLQTVYTAEDVDIRVYGDTAIVAFRLVGRAPDGVQQYFNTGTFLLFGDEWRAVAWQATKIPDPELAD